MASMASDDDDFSLDDYDDDMDVSEGSDLVEQLAARSGEGVPAKKRRWRDVEEYREWKRLRDLLGDDDMADLGF